MTRTPSVRLLSVMLALALAAVALPPDAARGDGEVLSVKTEALLVTDAAAAARSDGIDVRVDRDSAGLEVEGRCRINASASTAWDVLTDYDGIEKFVSSMKESRVTRRDDDGILVDQMATGRMFLFTRRIRTTLRVHEEPPGRIRFEDVLGRDFKSYRGEWRIEKKRGAVEIVYRLRARPSFSMPDFVMRGLFRDTAHDLLAEVRTEIERRAALALR
ncbi:MAG: SRPBCC family protein [Candidatus Eisenbacteria bacterium]